MGQVPYIQGSPADAGRALPGFRYALIPCGDAMRPSDPCRLRTRGAARSACPAHVTAARTRAARPVRACQGPVWPRHACGVAREWRSPWVRLAAHGGPRRGAGTRFRGRFPFLDCPSKPPIAAQSLDGGGLRPATVRPSPATGHANRPAIRHKWPAATGYAGLYSVCRTAPVFMPRCSSPKPRHRPAGRSLRGDL